MKARRTHLNFALGALVAVFATGCENKCDELVTVLTDCQSGDPGGGETDETDEPEGDAECSSEDAACATCILESKTDLCLEYGEALATCRDAGECE